MKSSRRKKILFTIPTLRLGGAEKVLTTLVNYWAENGAFDVVVLTHDKQTPFYSLHPKVRLIQTSYWRGSHRWRVFFSTYRCIKEESPDLVVSFILWNNIVTALCARFSRVPCLVAERSTPDVVRNPFVKFLRDWTYGQARGVIVQTKRGAEWLSRRLQRKVFVIPNPFNVGKRKKNLGEKCLVSAGRLASEKQFDFLIHAFASLSSVYGDWTLTILGEGPERPHLERVIHRYGLEQRVFLPGAAKDIHASMKKGSIFALTSRFEGMPNALAEAMALGLAVVSVDCPTGPRELIHDGDNGILVPMGDQEAFVTALKRVMDSQKLREALGKKASITMKQYDTPTVSLMWEQAWDQILGK